ncbi:hypothetical protein V1L54_20115 [Streptomyces sp. TRM 70361]|uniref:hypothetical protein n=1 Tax=Streptomyces sp. TRM 70361 TaxID=3116553 RepID=UPI002E7C1500|nr:hypothetical protein [Streptomyces sp. TRM 70361]MEE1941684.1 hypothetical protein [Streptomyces sp. TRM 70361]
MTDAAGSKWLVDINSDSPLELVLRGHLWIESRLIGVLGVVAPHPERIDFSRFTYPQKVALAAAHDFLEEEDVPAYLKLNSMRNKVAHRLDAALSEQDETDLINCLSPILRRSSMVDDARVAGRPWPYALRHVMAAMIIRLEERHKAYLKTQEDNRRLVEQMRKVTKELRTEREQRGAQAASLRQADAGEPLGPSLGRQETAKGDQ